MGRRRIDTTSVSTRTRKPRTPTIRDMAPATTPEARENQLVSLAHDLAERQIREGSVSSQVLTHFLKLGSTIGKLEQEKLHRENLLLSAKMEAINSGRRTEELFQKALDAMRHYTGQEVLDVDAYDD